MSEIQRYDFNPHDGEEGMEEAPDGDYVKFGDHVVVATEHVQNALREAAQAMCQLCGGGNKYVSIEPLLESEHTFGDCRWFHRFSDTKEIATSCSAWKIHDLISKAR